MPPPMQKRVDNLRIREDEALPVFSNSDRIQRTASEDTYTQAWFEYSRSTFPQSVTKTSTNVELHNVSTYQCSVLFNNMVFFQSEE